MSHRAGHEAEARCGVAREHHRLFEQLDRVARALEDASDEFLSTLGELERQMRELFEDEELSFRALSYPHAAEHQAQHVFYLRELSRVRDPDQLGPAGLAFLRAWLVNHGESDRRFAQWSAQAGRDEIRRAGSRTPVLSCGPGLPPER